MRIQHLAAAALLSLSLTGAAFAQATNTNGAAQLGAFNPAIADGAATVPTPGQAGAAQLGGFATSD
jgi:hypothetical protein